MVERNTRNFFSRSWIGILALVAALALAGIVVVLLSSASAQVPVRLEKAVFAGGCFWSLEASFEKQYGVISAISGYTGGKSAKPSYETYSRNGHVEAVQVSYDPSRISYDELLDIYWRSVDPTDSGGSFYDRGPNYRPVVYYANSTQKSRAEASRAALAKSGVFGKSIVVELKLASTFYPAEDYHQDYAKKNPEHYGNYREASGRDAFFRSAWGDEAMRDHGLPPSASGGNYVKPSASVLKAKLTPLQFEVTQKEGTEAPFDNVYAHSTGEGIYVDIVSGEALFSSRDKYDSGTGWPSFTQALAPANIIVVSDSSLGMVRDEVRSRFADSHLGHLFADGPPPTGLRFCMNSASLRFVPKASMEAEGYGYFLKYLK
jgi:peptide methionine sulfoxide reductase msrA/msrB